MNEKIIQSRINFEKLGENYPKAKGITIHKEIIDDVNCYWFKNTENISTSKIVIYLHGGCFALGSIRSHQALVSHLSKDLGLPFLFVEYSLAPENPYPISIFDVLKVYQQLIIKFPTSEFVIIGDSAGAGLSVSLLSKIYELGFQPPGIIILISPWIDLSCSNNSMLENANIDPILEKESLQEYASLYIGNQTLVDINPIKTISNKFPPTLILVGSDEILLDDSKLIFNKIIHVQAKTKLSIYEKQTHVWLLDNIHSDESQKAIIEIKTFLKDYGEKGTNR
jgi:monoterpene epsilon-lactone hydrolase